MIMRRMYVLLLGALTQSPFNGKAMAISALILRVVFGVLAVLAFFLFYHVGLLSPFHMLFLLAYVCYVIIQLVAAFFKQGRKRANEMLYIRIFSRCLLWFAGAFLLLYPIIPGQLGTDQYTRIVAIVLGLTVFGLACDVTASIMNRVRANDTIVYVLAITFFIQAFAIFCDTFTSLYVESAPPFKGEWYVIQGGESSYINHHYNLEQQSHAIDVVKQQDLFGLSSLEHSKTFGERLYSPVTGEVIVVVDGIHDNQIGETNLTELAGNYVVIHDDASSYYFLLAHLRKGSIAVKKGERVEVGDYIGECGNSGNSSQPHIHIQAQTLPSIFESENTTIQLAYPGRLKTPSGESVSRSQPRRNDIIVGEYHD